MSKVVKSSTKPLIKIKAHRQVELKVPQFKVDSILSTKLTEQPLLKHMNTHFACALIGAAGSGKTTLAMGLIATPNLYKRVFHKIYIFMPENSMSSIKNNVFMELPQDQIYNELTVDKLIECFEKVEANAKEEINSLVVFDDVQQFLKGPAESLLLHMINNRRHNRLSVMILAQSYIKIPRMARQAFTDLFLFRLSKGDYDRIFDELVHLDRTTWSLLQMEFLKEQKEAPNSFLYMSSKSQKYFINWNECLLNEDDGKQEEDG